MGFILWFTLQTIDKVGPSPLILGIWYALPRTSARLPWVRPLTCYALPHFFSLYPRSFARLTLAPVHATSVSVYILCLLFFLSYPSCCAAAQTSPVSLHTRPSCSLQVSPRSPPTAPPLSHMFIAPRTLCGSPAHVVRLPSSLPSTLHRTTADQTMLQYLLTLAC